MDTAPIDPASMGTVPMSSVVGVLLYGSRARGDASADSDVDLLVTTTGGRPYTSDTGRISISCYPIEAMLRRARSGDLFAFHLVTDAKMLFERRPVLAHRPMGAGTVRQRLDAVAAGHAHAAVQAFRPPMEGGLARELTFDAGADHPDAEARRGRRLGSRPAALGPAQEKAVRLQFPIHFHAPRHHR